MAVGVCMMRQHPTTWRLDQGFGGYDKQKLHKENHYLPLVGGGLGRTNICSTLGNYNEEM